MLLLCAFLVGLVAGLRCMMAPAIVSWSAVAPGTALHVLPPLVETSHCGVGGGVPDAVDSKTAL